MKLKLAHTLRTIIEQVQSQNICTSTLKLLYGYVLKHMPRVPTLKVFYYKGWWQNRPMSNYMGWVV